MKILHTADWHLDTPFAGVTAEQREFLRQELLKIPEKVAQIALREDCQLMLISGDVFDGAYTGESLDAVRKALGSCGIPVFVSPGNHDFCAPGSAWLEEQWPGNVHVFRGNMTSVALPELNCRVWGAGYTSMDCETLLEGFRAVGKEKYQIAVLHGDPCSVSSPYNPVTAGQVRDSGLRYLALGHIHKAGAFAAGETLCAWPGCPMGRGWDETGEKGLYIVDLETAELRAVPLNAPRFYDFQTETGEDAGAALEALLPPVESEDFYRVTLLGSGAGELDALYQRFSHVPNLTLRDERREKIDLWATAGEDTLEGVYFRMLRDAMQEADAETARQILLAAEISRKLLDGMEVVL